MCMGDLLLIGAAALIGFGSGILSALLGVGGAVVSTPAIRLVGASPIAAVGSTVPAVLPSAISGGIKYARSGLVDVRLAVTLGTSGAAFALVGAWVAASVDARLLMVATAALMAWSGISVVRSGRKRQPAPAAAEESSARPRSVGAAAAEPEVDTTRVRDVPTPVVALLGAGGGFMAGLLGIGGGVVLMPVLTGVLRLPVKRAVASSLVAVAILSVPALVAHLWFGHVDPRYAIPLVLGVIPGAQIGARITIASSEQTVRRAFGIFIVLAALLYGGVELYGILT